MPILGYILLETKKDGVKLTATDLELAIQTEVEAEVKQGGQMTLPARILTEIVGNLSPATVEIRGQEGAAPAEITWRQPFRNSGSSGGRLPHPAPNKRENPSRRLRLMSHG